MTVRTVSVVPFVQYIYIRSLSINFDLSSLAEVATEICLPDFD
jgi:hypothetical protein